jgi:hypothetical protein
MLLDIEARIGELATKEDKAFRKDTSGRFESLGKAPKHTRLGLPEKGYGW